MDVRDYVFIETNESCALCGQKNLGNLTEHHIDGNKKNNDYDNRIALCHNCHCRFHSKRDVTKESIVTTKRRLIVKTLSHFGLNAMKIARRNNSGVIAMPFLLYHLVDLGLMKQEESQMGYGEQEDATAFFSLTEKGKKFHDKWFKDSSRN